MIDLAAPNLPQPIAGVSSLIRALDLISDDVKALELAIASQDIGM